MTFRTLSELVNARFQEISKYPLFKSEVDGDTLWELYLSSFKKEHDPVFRDPNSTTHNGNNDKHFIRKYGNVVAIGPNYDILTMFDIDLREDNPYYLPLKATRAKIRVQTSQGPLSVEQLWDLKLTTLATLIRNVKKNIVTTNDSELSFLDEFTTFSAQEKETQLVFDVLKEIYLVKKAEKDALNAKAEKDEFKAKVLAAIKKKEEIELDKKSIDELMALIN